MATDPLHGLRVRYATERLVAVERDRDRYYRDARRRVLVEVPILGAAWLAGLWSGLAALAWIGCWLIVAACTLWQARRAGREAARLRAMLNHGETDTTGPGVRLGALRGGLG